MHVKPSREQRSSQADTLNFAMIFCAVIKNFLAFTAYFFALSQNMSARAQTYIDLVRACGVLTTDGVKPTAAEGLTTRFLVAHSNDWTICNLAEIRSPDLDQSIAVNEQ